MKKSFRSMMITVLALVLCLVMASSAALAETADGVKKERSATISASVAIKGTAPKPAEDYEIVMEADDAAYPMPEGSVEGKYTMTITGAASKSFPALTYSRVGIYTYKIYQQAGDNKECTYDSAVYTLVVTITNDGEGGLNIMAVLHAPDAEHKPDEVEFINTYPVDKGDDTDTGVDDSWPIFLACSVVLVGAGILLFWWIRRKDEDDDDLEFDEE